MAFLGLFEFLVEPILNDFKNNLGRFLVFCAYFNFILSHTFLK